MSSIEKDTSINTNAPVNLAGLKIRARRVWRQVMRRLDMLGIYYGFTSIGRRIVILNCLSLIILVGGLFYLSDFRDRLIEARRDSLAIQSSIIAQAFSVEGTVAITDNTDELIFGQPSESIYQISLEKVADLLRTLVPQKTTNGYVYAADGTWLMDSNRIYESGKIVQYQDGKQREDEVSWGYKTWLTVEHWLRGEALPPLEKISIQNGKSLPEVKAALEEGSTIQIARENQLGETILLHATPIQKGGAVIGALLMVTRDGEIDQIIAGERRSMAQLLSLILVVTVIVSLALSGTIAGPMRRLTQGAEKVRNNFRARNEIPDFSHRADEIGYLSRAFGDMTATLYERIESIESFAADVAHELKNPLTSLQSAVDTLPLVKREEDRDRLFEVIRHDIKRLDRLITDISNASRLDAELLRGTRHPVHIAALLNTICEAQNELHREKQVTIVFNIKGMTRTAALADKSPYHVSGDEGRLSQVIGNLIDNAMSFSSDKDKIYITCNLLRKVRELEITIEDEGPGIPKENLERVFERFYTDSSEREGFGNNSGLGLNISRQIIEAHKGRIWAENRHDSSQPPKVIGARFIIRIPMIDRAP